MEKDCEIVFCNKQTYKFNSKDLAKALEFCMDKRVFAIETPWGVLSLMDKETFDNVKGFVMDGPAQGGEGYDKQEI